MDTVYGSVTHWPEAVHYQLRTYAKNDAVSCAFRDRREMRQKAEESETRFDTHLLDP